MIKDEDSVCSSTGDVCQTSNSWLTSAETVHSRLLQKFLDLGIVFSLDLFVVNEVFLAALVAVDLETMAVESVFVLFAGNVTDRDIDSLCGAQVRLGLPVTACFSIQAFILGSVGTNLPYVSGRWGRSVVWEIEKSGVDVVLVRSSLLRLQHLDLGSARSNRGLKNVSSSHVVGSMFNWNNICF